VWAGGQVVLEFADANVAALTADDLAHRYLWGAAVDEALADEEVVSLTDAGENETLWLLADHLGTPRDIVDNDAALVDHVVYDAFGVPDAGSRIGLGGVIVDEETGLRFHRARWAEAETNQFLSEDPILSGPNRRIYGANSPQRYTDPWGLLPVDPPPGGVRAISHIFYVKFSQWIQPDSTSCRKF
jgi:RHS repeat-associated protein